MSTGENYVGVILAAGKGRRVRLFSEALPKPLLPVLDSTLLVRQVEALRGSGVREICVVVGHLGHQIVRELGTGEELGVRITYAEQERALGTAHALAPVEAWIDRPFVLLLGDVSFDPADLRPLFQRFGEPGVAGVLAVREEEDEDRLRRNFTVALDADGAVARVVEKPTRPETRLKGCGLYLFDPRFFDAVRRTPRTALRDEYELTDSIQIFVDQGHRVVTTPLLGQDLNLTEPQDLLLLNLEVLAERGLDRYVADTAEVHPAAELEQTIVLGGAQVGPDTQLRRCLVFAGERVPAGEYAEMIFHAGEALPAGSAR